MWVVGGGSVSAWLLVTTGPQVTGATTTLLLPAGGEGLLPVVVATFTPTQLATCCTMVKWVWSDIVIINHLKTPATGQAPGMVPVSVSRASQGRVAKHSVSGESSEAQCPPLTSSAAIVGLISSLAAGTTTTSQAALLGSGDTSPPIAAGTQTLTRYLHWTLDIQILDIQTLNHIPIPRTRGI